MLVAIIFIIAFHKIGSSKIFSNTMSTTEGKVIECRAAVAWEPKKPLIIEAIQVAPPKSHEVRIRIVASGVCHTDWNALGGLDTNIKFPVILGHEGAGIVESVGEGVENFKPGDHVIPLYLSQCNECKCCKSNKTNLCTKLSATQIRGVLLDNTTRFTCKGQAIQHFFGVSTFSEYTVVTDISLCKVDEHAPLEKICLLGCAIPTGYGAAIKTAKVEPGSICAIWGLGAVGLAAAMGCAKSGAARVFGIDINSAKFEVAKKFGVIDFINPKEIDDQRPIQQYLIELTGGGFDYAFECIGNVHTMRAAFESTHRGWGTTIVIGLSPSGQEIGVLPLQLIMGRNLKGSGFGGWKSVSEIPSLVQQYMRNEIMVDEFITHTMKLDAVNEAFDLMHSGKSIRSVIEF